MKTRTVCLWLWAVCCTWLVGPSPAARGESEKMRITFEEFIGHDTSEIGDFYPGVIFEELYGGHDWRVCDSTTGYYNISSWPSGEVMGCAYGDCGSYWIHGAVCAWAEREDQPGAGGVIYLDNDYTYSVEVGYSCGHPLTLDAYDAGGLLLGSDLGPANLRIGTGGGNQDGPGTLRVDAPAGKRIASVIIHDSGNHWFADDIQLGAALDVVKFDDVNGLDCRGPGDALLYTIGIASKYRDQTNVWITDTLPRGADYVSAAPDTGTYDLLTHTYTWHLDTLAGYDPNDPSGPADPNTYFYLYTQVNEMAEPAGEIVNAVTVDSDQWTARAHVATPICCWGGNVIYVDRNAPGYYETGTDWSSAYRDLQDAIARINRGCGNEIRIADGTYYPGGEYSDAFEMPAGVAVYGGWAGYGAANPDERDPRRYRTILSGYIDENSNNNTVVKITGDDVLLDGVIAEEGYLRGIDGSNVTSTVTNCVIRENERMGIYCPNGNMDIFRCEVYNNGYQGIYHEGSGKSLVIERCKVHDNQRDGILTAYSAPVILNSLIYQNGLSSTIYNPYYGINFATPGINTKVFNNTIVHNTKEGIRRNGGSLPSVKNCIVFYNNSEEDQLTGLTSQQVTYCCVPDCNEINNQHNIPDPPDFVYDSEPYGFYHIKYESPCRNAGDSSVVGQYETDMDGEERIQEGLVDIGADEVSCTETWHANDWTYDGVINLEDYAILSAAWLSVDPNSYSPPKDPQDEYIWYVKGWGPKADLNDDHIVYLDDLAIFCESDYDNWLWQACWKQSEFETLPMMMSGGETMSTPLISEPLYTAQTLQTESLEVVYESTPAKEADSIRQILDVLNATLEEATPENEEGTHEMITILEGWLAEIEY